MTLVEPSFNDLLYIAANMREADKSEIFATRWDDSPMELAKQGMMPLVRQFAFVAKLKGVPVAAIGAFPAHPLMWNVWMFATDEFPKIGLPFTRWVKKIFVPTMHKNARRAECRSECSHHYAHRWMEAIGGKKEATLSRYGKQGQDYYIYAWQSPYF